MNKINMNEMMKKYSEKTDWIIFKIATIIVVLFYGVNFSIEYATDTYSTFQEAETWKWMLYENGRLINACIYFLMEKFEISVGYVYKMSYVLAIFSLIISVYLLGKIISEYCENKFISATVSFLTISNFFVIEYFLFIEKGMFMVAIMLCTIAAYFTKSYFDDNNRSYLLVSLICLLIAVFIYQLMLAVYVVLCLPFVIKCADNWKKFIRNNIVVALSYAIPMLVAYIITKFFLGSSRAGNIENVSDNLLRVLPTIWEVSWKQWFHMGEHIFAACVLLVVIGVIIYINGIQKTYVKSKNFYGVIYVVVGTIFTAFFPQITGIGDIVAPRTLYAYGCLPGILAIYGIIIYSNNTKKTNQILFGVLITVVLAVQYLNSNSVFLERYKANQNDKYYCEIIGEKIKEYEEDTGIVIDTICFYYDKSVKWYDSGCDETMQSPRAQSCGWSNLTSLNMYLYKDYKKGDCEVEYETYFGQYNWDTYSEKQVIFKENILHLCIY